MYLGADFDFWLLGLDTPIIVWIMSGSVCHESNIPSFQNTWRTGACPPPARAGTSPPRRTPAGGGGGERIFLEGGAHALLEGHLAGGEEHPLLAGHHLKDGCAPFSEEGSVPSSEVVWLA